MDTPKEDVMKVLGTSLRGTNSTNRMVGQKYFMVQAEKLLVSRADPDSFYVVGVRQDTQERITFQSKRQRSSQFLPEPGAMVRLDRAENLKQIRSDYSGLKHFRAEYFHAYPSTGFAVKAVACPREPRLENDMLGATTLLFDTEVNCFTFDIGQHYEKVEEFVAGMLRPWLFRKESSTTHDMLGKPIWSREANLGITPTVMIRVSGVVGSQIVYGLGAVKRQDESYGLPSIEDIARKLMLNSKFAEFMQALKATGKEALSGVHMTIIPGAAVRVGRESVQNEKYLGTPLSYQWENREARNDPTRPQFWRGYKESWLHLQRNQDGRMMVVDCHPVSGARLTGWLPESRTEKELIARQAAAAVATSRAQQTNSNREQTLAPPQQPASVASPQQSSVQPAAKRQALEQASSAAASRPAVQQQAKVLPPEASAAQSQAPVAAVEAQSLRPAQEEDEFVSSYQEFDEYASSEHLPSNHVEHSQEASPHEPLIHGGSESEAAPLIVEPGARTVPEPHSTPAMEEFDEELLNDLAAIESMQTGSAPEFADDAFHDSDLEAILDQAAQEATARRLKEAESQVANRQAGISQMPRMG